MPLPRHYSDCSRDLRPAEVLILNRLRRIDRGPGCFATIDYISRARAGTLEPSLSESYTRRIIAYLRKRELLRYAGQSKIVDGGTCVYLLADREYVAADVAAILSTSHPPIWPPNADPVLREGRVTPTQGRAIDGYPISRSHLAEFGEECLKEAIRRIRKTYPGEREKEIVSRSGLLRSVAREVREERKKAPADSAPKRRERMRRDDPPEMFHELARQFSGQGPAAPSPSPQPLPAPSAPPPAAPHSSPPVSSPFTVSDALALRIREKTIAGNAETLDFVVGKCKPLRSRLGNLPLIELTRARVQEYVESRRADRISLHCIDKELRQLKIACRLALEDGHPVSTALHWPRLKGVYVPRTRYLTREEYSKVLGSLSAKKQAWVILACGTGARRSELLRICRQDVDLVEKTVRIRVTKREGSADREETRTTILVPEVEALVTDLGARAGPLLEPWGNYKRDLKQACHKLGIKPLSMNDFRRTFITWCLEKGVPMPHVEKMVGHGSSRMIGRVYAQLSRVAVQDAVAKFSTPSPS